MKPSDKKKIKKKLIEALAFLEADAHKGIPRLCEQIVDIIDEARWDEQDTRSDEDDEDEERDEDDW